MNFPYPIYFVYSKFSDNEDYDSFDNNNISHIISNGEDCWILQTYLNLKWAGYTNVYLVPKIVPDSICVIHYWELAVKQFPYKSFIVAIQSDTPLAPLANIRVVQNQLRINSQNDHYIKLWPQPGLLSRNAMRGTRVENIVYHGLPIYLTPQFQTPDFQRLLADIGMSLRICPNPDAWGDYSDVDVVLAVRDVSWFDVTGKPPSKLVNAWRANCPALLGPEPGYQQLRKDNLDYVEICTPDEAYQALVKLKNNPELYQAMVDRCKNRSDEFSQEYFTRQWSDFFYGIVPLQYEKWLDSRKSLHGRFIELLLFIARAFQHKRKRKEFYRLIKKPNVNHQHQ